ncbi:MAG: hypothetical protein MUO57_19215 [Anaerolineales bacterium]|nr:hypothetical protein [Anaerolineales bacterium]
MKNNCVRFFVYLVIIALLMQTSPTQALPISTAMEIVPKSIGPQQGLPEPRSMLELELPDEIRNPQAGLHQPAEERVYIPPTATELALTAAQVRIFDCSTVTDLLQVECEALVALYGSTNGAGWTNNTNWLLTTTVDDWFGVTVTGGHASNLFLNNNQLDGSIPSGLGNLSSLKLLYLDNNQLSGSIPPELDNLSSLEGLSLSDNQLSGSIPPELGNLSNLQYLGLEYNQLSGNIPLELGNLSNLQYLRLNSNQLSGSVPLSFVNLSSLILFYFIETSLCEPDTPEFLAWKATITFWNGTGNICQPPDDYSVFLPLIMNNQLCSNAPTLLEPANGANLDNLIPLFRWNNGNDPDATELYLEMTRDADFTHIFRSFGSNFSGGIQEFRFTQNFGPSLIIYWRAYLVCGETQSPYSEAWSFTTGSGGIILPAPSLLAPADDSMLPSLPVDLEWSTVDNAVEYGVHWTLAGSGGYSMITTTNTSFTIGEYLTPNTTYDWWITARNDYAWGTDSVKWQFTTPAETLSIPRTNLIPVYFVGQDGSVRFTGE